MKCITSDECPALPTPPPMLRTTWDGFSNKTQDYFDYFCHMDGKRGTPSNGRRNTVTDIIVHATYDTSTEPDAHKLAVLPASQYFLFRDSTIQQKKLIQFRVTSEGSAFIIISPRAFPLHSSLYLELKKDEIVFGKYNGIAAKELFTEPAELEGVLDLWLYFQSMALYIGKQGNKTRPPETLARFLHKQLPETNHLGLSNIGLGEWVVHEGEV